MLGESFEKIRRDDRMMRQLIILLYLFQAAGVTCYLDEERCTKTQWQCKNERCIEFPYYCDQVDDCGDGSDEDMDACTVSHTDLNIAQ